MSNVSVFVAHEGCPHRCSFCDQHIISGQTEKVSAQQLENTLDTALHSLKEKACESQIAFFGGSFTAIERSYAEMLLKTAEPYLKYFNGIRISTRPDAIDEEVLAFLKSYGVKAIELGAQSTDEEVLKLNRRGHGAADTERASRLIKENGFELGLQMMTGLYGDSEQKCIQTAKDIIALKPATVRIYPTVVLEGTELDALYKAGKYTPQSVDEAAELCVKLIRLFEQAGIKIIRLGLHASEEVRAKMTAGAYHPAFKEICLSRIYLQNTLEALKNVPEGEVNILVGEKYISQFKGQKKQNIKILSSKGYNVNVFADAGLGKYEVRIK